VIGDVLLSSALASSVLKSFDVGVSTTATRRRFTPAYKVKILAAAASCVQPGDVGALLRREGLYSSHLAAWRAAQRRGELTGPVRRRGPKRAPPDPSAKRIVELERHLARVTARAERAEALVAVQKKVAALWEQMAPASDDAPTGRR
jgi:transposase-like protein